MHRILVRAGGRALAGSLVLIALAVPVSASARPVTAHLRVQGPTRALEAGRSYVTDTARFKTDTRPPCGGSGKTLTLAGPTALGIVDSAAETNRSLRPFGVSDKFSFGLLVCKIGRNVGSDKAFWLYKVDHVAPSVGADQYRVRRGDSVLWFFQDTARNLNTGDELVLGAPASATPGSTITAIVKAYPSGGEGVSTRPLPVEGATVTGGSAPVVTNAAGEARVTLGEKGVARLRATRGSDIPAEVERVCVDLDRSRCGGVHGEEIVGSSHADRIVGTRGADVVSARGGNDRIYVRGGAVDVVRCGRGRDVVYAGREDRAIARDCERVVRR